jgi:hypothetical protein
MTRIFRMLLGLGSGTILRAGGRPAVIMEGFESLDLSSLRRIQSKQGSKLRSGTLQQSAWDQWVEYPLVAVKL